MKKSVLVLTFVACLGLVSSLRAQLIVLPSTWGEWDYKQYLYGGIGNLVVSNQSSTGFTAWVATNDVEC